MEYQHQVIRIADVMKVTRLSRSSLYRLLVAGNLPQPVRIGVRGVAWYAQEIDQWLAQRERVETAGVAQYRAQNVVAGVQP